MWGEVILRYWQGKWKKDENLIIGGGGDRERRG